MIKMREAVYSDTLRENFKSETRKSQTDHREKREDFELENEGINIFTVNYLVFINSQYLYYCENFIFVILLF